MKVAKDHAPTLSCDAQISVTICADSGMLASDYCPNVETAYVLDLSQPNVSAGWGYKRDLLTTPLSAAMQATYQAQLAEGLITSIPAGEPVRTNSGTVQLYSDLMYSGMCTTHITPLEPTTDPNAPDNSSESGDSGEQRGTAAPAAPSAKTEISSTGCSATAVQEDDKKRRAAKAVLPLCCNGCQVVSPSCFPATCESSRRKKGKENHPRNAEGAVAEIHRKERGDRRQARLRRDELRLDVFRVTSVQRWSASSTIARGGKPKRSA